MIVSFETSSPIRTMLKKLMLVLGACRYGKGAMRESKPAARPQRILNLLTLALLILVVGMAIPNESFACHKTDSNGDPRPHGKNATCPPDDGGGGANNTADTYNLARADFEDVSGGGGGIYADGVDTCTIERNGDFVTYDYWAWQEEFLSDAESMLDDGVALGEVEPPCNPYPNRSDVSGGGRWFLMSPSNHEEPVVKRWLVVDFSDSDDFSTCWNLDGGGVDHDDLDIDTPLYDDFAGQITAIDPLPCVDHLAVWLKADRILKKKASMQQLEIIIRHRGNEGRYWVPWGSIRHIHPLFLRDPVAGGPFDGRDCTVMSTRPAPGEEHISQEAELYKNLGPSSDVLIGTYNLPLEVCVIRASE